MSTQVACNSRFVRRTTLKATEYRKNFRQIDGDIISAVTSREADRVTPLMSKIYLRLVHAPCQYREREGVLRFEGEVRDGAHLTAWDALCEVVGVASATARKALLWMHEQGIIGYFSGKNGVGLRIFLNRASSSIGTRPAGQKILEFPHASSHEGGASVGEAGFMDSFAVLEVLEPDVNPRAPKNGAGQTHAVDNLPPPPGLRHTPPGTGSGQGTPAQASRRAEVPLDDLVVRLRRELEPSLQTAARRAAAQEHERTREWLESKGLPKAARVAQRETFNLLRQHGLVKAAARRGGHEAATGDREQVPAAARPLSHEEVRELAETCVAMWEVHGQPFEVTLAGLSAEAGGALTASDASKVRESAELMAHVARAG